MSVSWRSMADEQPRVVAYMDTLGRAAPKSLLLEGGTPAQRLALGRFWAARLNCPDPAPPCGQCASCQQIDETVFRDLILLDGSAGTLSIDEVRAVRGLMSEPPAGSGTRVIIFAEAQALSDGAANALLKSLEEPGPGTVFVLLAPNREILLPTLVSRSFVLTLSWPTSAQESACAAWITALAQFVQTGRGTWLEWTGKKGAVDSGLGYCILQEAQRALLQAGYGNPVSDLARVFAQRLDVVAIRQATVILENTTESLDAGANPAVVVEWMAMRLWGLVHK